jgi:hypothetical protein
MKERVNFISGIILCEFCLCCDQNTIPFGGKFDVNFYDFNGKLFHECSSVKTLFCLIMTRDPTCCEYSVDTMCP